MAICQPGSDLSRSGVLADCAGSHRGAAEMNLHVREAWIDDEFVATDGVAAISCCCAIMVMSPDTATAPARTMPSPAPFGLSETTPPVTMMVTRAIASCSRRTSSSSASAHSSVSLATVSSALAAVFQSQAPAALRADSRRRVARSRSTAISLRRASTDCTLVEQGVPETPSANRRGWRQIDVKAQFGLFRTVSQPECDPSRRAPDSPAGQSAAAGPA